MNIEEWLNNDQLGIDIWNKKYRHNSESLDNWFERVSGGDQELKKLIIDKKFLFGGRTLSNRGTNKGSYSNCYSSGRVGDSLKEIMHTNTELALTYQSQGGQGLSLSNIRPKGSIVADHFISDGIVPFMKIFNSTTGCISQGDNRRGALMMSLDIEHPEAETFMSIKSDQNEINNANLSMEISDEFMNAVVSGESYVSSRKYKGYEKEYLVNPGKLFKQLATQAWKSAEPGIMFMNKFSNYNIMEFSPIYEIFTSNPCGEQPLPKYGSCNLGSINLSEYILNRFTKIASFDFISFENDIKVYVSALDSIIDETADLHALIEQKEFSKKYRNLGLGIMGVADMMLMLGIKYGSEKCLSVMNEIMDILIYECIKQSIFLSKKSGPFEGWSNDCWNSEFLSNYNALFNLESLRNSSLLSIAPTGSIGTMLGISTGCEPYYRTSFERKTTSLTKGEEVSYIVHMKAYSDFINSEIYDEDIVVTAENINYIDRIKYQAILQKYVDTAISSTINLPNSATVEDIEDIYMKAWEYGCKGITVYRDGSRDAILSDLSVSKSIESSMKRPVELKAKVVKFKNGSEEWISFIGLNNDKPYEIFTGIRDLESFPVPSNVTEGIIIKNKENGISRYDFKFKDQYGFENILGGLSRVFNQEYWNYAKLISALLRNEIDLQKVIKLIEGMTFESASLNNWRDGIKRILKGFIKDGTKIGSKCPSCGEQSLIFNGGCVSCTNCGESKCG